MRARTPRAWSGRRPEAPPSAQTGGGVRGVTVLMRVPALMRAPVLVRRQCSDGRHCLCGWKRLDGQRRAERGAVDDALADAHEEGEEHQYRQCRAGLRQWSAGGHATTVLRRAHALVALTVVEDRDGLPGAVQQAAVAGQRVGA